MNSSLFSQAIDEAFPELDPEMRDEIRDKVTSHMLVIMKEKVFANDQEGLKKLYQFLEDEIDVTKRTELYVKQIIDKFVSLSDEEREKINHELDEELTRVMHTIYQAYE